MQFSRLVSAEGAGEAADFKFTMREIQCAIWWTEQVHEE